MSSPSPRSSYPPLLSLMLLLCLALLCWWVFRPNAAMAPILPRELDTAQTALKAGDSAKARTLFDQALRDRPNDSLTYLQIISLCQTNKQWGLAVSYSQSALCIFKDAPATVRAELNAQLSVAYAEAEPARPQKNALYAAEAAWQLDPQNPEMQNAYGYVLADNDQELDLALDLIQQALKTAQSSMDPNLKLLVPLSEDSYGWVLHKKERYKEAADMLLKALYDYPEGTSGEVLKASHYHLGATYHRLNQIEEARQCLRSALYYDANYADAKAELEKLSPPASSSSFPASAGAPPTSVPDPAKGK